MKMACRGWKQGDEGGREGDDGHVSWEALDTLPVYLGSEVCPAWLMDWIRAWRVST